VRTFITSDFWRIIAGAAARLKTAPARSFGTATTQTIRHVLGANICGSCAPIQYGGRATKSDAPSGIARLDAGITLGEGAARLIAQPRSQVSDHLAARFGLA
jgi:hypothetical protein